MTAINSAATVIKTVAEKVWDKEFEVEFEDRRSGAYKKLELFHSAVRQGRRHISAIEGQLKVQGSKDAKAKEKHRTGRDHIRRWLSNKSNMGAPIAMVAGNHLRERAVRAADVGFHLDLVSPECDIKQDSSLEKWLTPWVCYRKPPPKEGETQRTPHESLLASWFENYESEVSTKFGELKDYMKSKKVLLSSAIVSLIVANNDMNKCCPGPNTNMLQWSHVPELRMALRCAWTGDHDITAEGNPFVKMPGYITALVGTILCISLSPRVRGSEPQLRARPFERRLRYIERVA